MSGYAEPVRGDLQLLGIGDEQVLQAFKGGVVVAEAIVGRYDDWEFYLESRETRGREIDRVTLTSNMRAAGEDPLQRIRGEWQTNAFRVLDVDRTPLQLVEVIEPEQQERLDSFAIERGADWAWTPPPGRSAVVWRIRRGSYVPAEDAQAIVE